VPPREVPVVSPASLVIVLSVIVPLLLATLRRRTGPRPASKLFVTRVLRGRRATPRLLMLVSPTPVLYGRRHHTVASRCPRVMMSEAPHVIVVRVIMPVMLRPAVRSEPIASSAAVGWPRKPALQRETSVGLERMQLSLTLTLGKVHNLRQGLLTSVYP
jgi:hypothetical protein